MQAYVTHVSRAHYEATLASQPILHASGFGFLVGTSDRIRACRATGRLEAEFPAFFRLNRAHVRSLERLTLPEYREVRTQGDMVVHLQHFRPGVAEATRIDVTQVDCDAGTATTLLSLAMDDAAARRAWRRVPLAGSATDYEACLYYGGTLQDATPVDAGWVAAAMARPNQGGPEPRRLGDSPSARTPPTGRIREGDPEAKEGEGP